MSDVPRSHDRPLRICLAARSLRAEESSLGRVMGDLAYGLAAEGHAVHLITGSPAPREGGYPAPDGGPLVHPLPTHQFTERLEHDLPFGELAYAAAVRHHVRRLHTVAPIDVLCAPLWTCEGALAVLDSAYPTVVSCMTSMRTQFGLHPEWRSHADKRFRMVLERASVRNARGLHGLTEASLRDCLAEYGPAEARAAVIPRGLADRAGGGSPGNREGADGSGGTPVGGADGSGDGPRGDAESLEDRPVEVLFVGRLERRKGVDVLLDAGRALLREGSNVRFTLVGRELPHSDGGIDPAAVRDARDGWAANVTIPGPVSDEQLDRYLRRSSIVCVPSRYEAHGVVLVEGMMFGKPLVTCSVGGIPEVVEDGANALLVPPDDAGALAGALRRLIEDRDLRTALGAASRRRFEERFDIRVVAPRMASFLAEVARDHAREHTGEHHDRRAERRIEELLAEIELELPGRALGIDAAIATTPAVPEATVENDNQARTPTSPFTSQELLVHRQASREWEAQAALELQRRADQRQAWAERAAEIDRAARVATRRLLEVDRQARAGLERIAELERQVGRQEEEASELRRSLDVMARSRSWRLTRPMRRASMWGRRLGQREGRP
jgi:glycosyltransferase involved in cell wall biosynthesis